jgi:hypothetical protein
MPEAKVKAGVDLWLLLNHGRHVLKLAAWVAALKAQSAPR